MPSPRIGTSAHALGCFQNGSSGWVPSATATRFGSSAAGSRAAIIQPTAARKAGTAHRASAPAQPTASAHPAAVAAATAAPPMIPVV
ncbi:hypothetical protein D3C73_900780 [compost metagenome]